MDIFRESTALVDIIQPVLLGDTGDWIVRVAAWV